MRDERLEDKNEVRIYTYHRDGVALTTNSYALAMERNDGTEFVTYRTKKIK
jgi:hypothetical protein